MQIINLFYELARQHNQIRSFYYGKSYEKGSGNEAHTLVWLDDPLYGRSVNQTIAYTCNVDFLGIPEDDKNTIDVQTAAFTVGLEFAEKIKQEQAKTGFSLSDFSFISLRDYYDNKAAGYRFTYTIIQANPVDKCNNDFDPNKQFPTRDALPQFNIENPDGCAVFTDKNGLPNFKITNPDGCTVFK
jgi:hypothetical protein